MSVPNCKSSDIDLKRMQWHFERVWFQFALTCVVQIAFFFHFFKNNLNIFAILFCTILPFSTIFGWFKRLQSAYLHPALPFLVWVVAWDRRRDEKQPNFYCCTSTHRKFEKKSAQIGGKVLEDGVLLEMAFCLLHFKHLLPTEMFFSSCKRCVCVDIKNSNDLRRLSELQRAGNGIDLRKIHYGNVNIIPQRDTYIHNNSTAFLLEIWMANSCTIFLFGFFFCAVCFRRFSYVFPL